MAYLSDIVKVVVGSIFYDYNYNSVCCSNTSDKSPYYACNEGFSAGLFLCVENYDNSYCYDLAL